MAKRIPNPEYWNFKGRLTRECSDIVKKTQAELMLMGRDMNRVKTVEYMLLNFKHPK